MIGDEQHGAAPRARGRIGRIFVGTDGLRAGWSILLFLAVLTILSLSAFHLLPLGRTDPLALMEPDRQIVLEIVQLVTILAAAFILSLVERRPFARYGLGGTRAVRDGLTGLVWGLVALSVLIGLLVVTGTLVFDGVALGGGAALAYGVKWLLVFAGVGLFEEFLFRGYLQFTLARGVAGLIRWVSPGNRRAATFGFWVAAAVFSVGLFALAHTGNGGETLLGLTSVGLVGIVFAFSLWRTGSLWWAIGFHASWDWAQSFVYGVRDSGLAVLGHLLNSHPAGNALLSGGITGPEGSILIIPTLLLVMLVIHITLPRRAVTTR